MKKCLSFLLVLTLLFSFCSAAFATEEGGTIVVVEETPTPGAQVVITKHPTGESVDEGDSAKFVAHADNATGIVWRIVSHDASNTVQAADAPNYFSGVSVSGLDSDVLELHNIPASMDGWYIEAMYTGPGGPVYSNGAMITVNGVRLKSPTISAQPTGASLESGQTASLTVSAATVNGSLRFQWYKNTANSNTGGSAIEGANSASYTPEEITGTTYYYVTVKSVDGEKESSTVASNAVAVTYAEAAEQPPETETPEETPAPTQIPLVPVVDGGEDPASDGQTAPVSDEGSRDNSRSASSAVERASNALNMLTVVGGVLAVAAVAGGITALVLRARGDDDDDEE